MTTTPVTLGIERYNMLRECDIAPIHVKEKAAELWGKSSDLSMTVLVDIVTGIVAYALATRGLRTERLWITSPSGKTTRQLPFWTAMRVVRKKEWSLTVVEPVCPLTPRGPVLQRLHSWARSLLSGHS